MASFISGRLHRSIDEKGNLFSFACDARGQGSPALPPSFTCSKTNTSFERRSALMHHFLEPVLRSVSLETGTRLNQTGQPTELSWTPKITDYLHRPSSVQVNECTRGNYAAPVRNDLRKPWAEPLIMFTRSLHCDNEAFSCSSSNQLFSPIYSHGRSTNQATGGRDHQEGRVIRERALQRQRRRRMVPVGCGRGR